MGDCENCIYYILEECHLQCTHGDDGLADEDGDYDEEN